MQDTQPEYDTLTGTGRHINTPEPPCASPKHAGRVGEAEYGGNDVDYIVITII